MDTPYRFTIEPTGRRASKAWRLTVRSPTGKQVLHFASEQEAAEHVALSEVGSPEHFMGRLQRDMDDVLGDQPG